MKLLDHFRFVGSGSSSFPTPWVLVWFSLIATSLLGSCGGEEQRGGEAGAATSASAVDSPAPAQPGSAAIEKWAGVYRPDMEDMQAQADAFRERVLAPLFSDPDVSDETKRRSKESFTRRLRRIQAGGMEWMRIGADGSFEYYFESTSEESSESIDTRVGMPDRDAGEPRDAATRRRGHAEVWALPHGPLVLMCHFQSDNFWDGSSPFVLVPTDRGLRAMGPMYVEDQTNAVTDRGDTVEFPRVVHFIGLGHFVKE